MNLDEIQALWDEDSKIDQDELHVESTKIPSLHAKYYKIYNNLTLLKKVEEIKLKQTKKEKWLYYTGKADPEIYICLLYTSPSPRDKRQSRMPSSA